MKRSNSRRMIGVLALVAVVTMIATPVRAATWSNTDATYPPGESQNWTNAANWGGSVPSAEGVNIGNGGSALIDSTVPDITTFLIGNSANDALTHSLYIAAGGTLNVTSTAATAFRLYNTAGTHQVTVASGGTLTVAGTLANGATGGSGSTSIFSSAGTVNALSVKVDKGATYAMTDGVLTTTQTFDGLWAINGLFAQSGGTASLAASVRLGPDGVCEVRGGSLAANGSIGLFFRDATASTGGTFRVIGSGATSPAISVA